MIIVEKILEFIKFLQNYMIETFIYFKKKLENTINFIYFGFNIFKFYLWGCIYIFCQCWSSEIDNKKRGVN